MLGGMRKIFNLTNKYEKEINMYNDIINSNFGVSMVQSYSLLFNHSNYQMIRQIERDFNLIPSMHIYMVLKVPKVYFDNKSIRLKNNVFTVDILYFTTKLNKLKYSFDNYAKKVNLNIAFNLNNEQLVITDSEGNTLFSFNAIMVLLSQGIRFKCEVLYIGRSFGKDGKRTVFERLEAHSTLQKIYAEKEDGYQIILSAWDFDRNTLTYISSSEQNPENSVRVFNKQVTMMRNPYEYLDKKQEICFTEAALIRYFQPRYNDKHKYNFPSNQHSEYKDLYTLEIDYVAVELYTKGSNIELFSEGIKSDYKHNIFYSLKNKLNFSDFFRLS